MSMFELAADSIAAGELTTLEGLLREDPGLIHARSTREHRATLLHYVSANGIEEYRQRTPENVVPVARVLLHAGADVNAEANIYGGGATALRLVATSVHPERAGVQEELMQLLLDFGAEIDPTLPSENHTCTVNVCLANGRGKAAEFLAHCGARLDLEASAGVERLDLVQSYFDEKGNLKSTASRTQMQRGFLWACQFGKDHVIDFLLQRGADLLDQAGTGETGLHWAVVGGHVETIRLLLKYGASLEVRNSYGGTALGQAFWTLVNDDSGIDYVPVIETLVEAGAKIEHGTVAWVEEQRLVPAVKERIVRSLRHYGATS